MKRYFLLAVTLVTLKVSAVAQSTITSMVSKTNDINGPYLIYKNQEIIEFKVVREQGKPVAQRVAHPLNEKKDLNLIVAFSNHKNWDFSVKLKDSLKAEPCVWAAPKKILVLSDIEGEFEGLRSLLIGNKVMDENYNWTFGKGHLVIAGDLFDRGKDVVAELWLLYKLEQDAVRKGGYIHTLLGNHDIMNLSGDLRYVDPKYMEDAKAMDMNYMSLYDRDTELGRWLRSKNIIEKIGDNLVTHGGISPLINAKKMSVAEINNLSRPYYDVPKKQLPLSVQVFFGKDGPFWYRGYFMKQRATAQTIDSTLYVFDCKKIIVGHTIVDINISLYYDGKVLGVDVDEHSGKRAGALFTKGKWYRIDDKGNRELLIYRKENDVINESQIL